MKKIFSLLLLCAAVVLASCVKNDKPADSVAVAFKSVVANGNETKTTSALTLTFDKTIDGLVVGDIKLTANETGATKGALTAKGNGVYELAINGVAKGGDVSVEITKAGYTITPASKDATLNFAGLIAEQVAFNSLTANGNSTKTTTALTLTFNKVIKDLSVDNITLTSTNTGATKGALTSKSAGTYELAITGITANGDVNVAVAKEGIVITPAVKTVAIYK